MIPNTNRTGSTHPNRVKLTPLGGDYYNFERADNPSDPGTLPNKAKFDEILAAANATTGTGDAYLLAQPGFVLFDGAPIRAMLHVKSKSKATINVEGTGAKPMVTAMSNSIGGILKKGSWVEGFYSLERDAYVLNGTGGGQVGPIFTEIDDIELRCCQDIHNATGWRKITFPVPFTETPKVAVSGVQGNHLVQLRNITIDGFEYDVLSLSVTSGTVYGGASASATTTSVATSVVTGVSFSSVNISYPIMFIAMVDLGV